MAPQLVYNLTGSNKPDKLSGQKEIYRMTQYPQHPTQVILPTTRVDVRFKRHNKFLRDIQAQSINWESPDILGYRLVTEPESEWIMVSAL